MGEVKRNNLDTTAKAIMIYRIIVVKQIHGDYVVAILELCLPCALSPFWQIDNLQKMMERVCERNFKKKRVKGQTSSLDYSRDISMNISLTQC